MPAGPLLKSPNCSALSESLYSQVPKEIEENLVWRRELWQRSATDREFQQVLRDACREDMLFFVNAFCWTFDPRKPIPKLPFITWGFQDNSLLVLDEAMPTSQSRGHDVLIEKSRDMGASWMCLTLMFWRWMFRPMQSFLMVSRKEALVDGMADSLFSHMDFLLTGLPPWLAPTTRRNKLKLYNLDNGSKIDGEASVDDLGRGGRRTAILIDEFAAFEGGGWPVRSATADTTTCRLFNSTPNGTANAFYAQRENGTPRLRLHWTEHPEKAAGLFHDAKGLPHSPWYDEECRRRAHPVEIATQLDIDYQGSAYPYFDPKTLGELREEFCRPASYIGTLYVEPDYEPRFEEDDVGPLRIWTELDEIFNPRADRDYVVGADVSQGTGASFSALSVGDRLSGEKVAELAVNDVSANRFAELAVALCRMFAGPGGRPAFLIWEATGPGRTFGKTIMEEIRFSNVYHMTDDRRLSRKESDRPGWFSTADGKKDLLAHYRDSLFTRKFLNPSERALHQAGEFVYLPNGRIEHGGSTNSIDPTDRGDNHGDIVIADALVAKILRERQVREKRVEAGPPVGSFAWRRAEARRELAASSEW